MPTALPPDSDFNGSARTEGQQKTFITAVRAYLAGLLGTDGDPATARTALGVPAGGSGVPAGMILPFAGQLANIPAGFLNCDGSAVSRTTYAVLFAAIGTTWGVGDGSTTFNVPNAARRVLVGSGGSGSGTLGNAVGNLGGEETHVLTTAELASHTHGAGSYVGPVISDGGSFALARPPSVNTNLTGTSNPVTGTSAATGSGTAHNTMQPSAVVLIIIKT